MAIYSCNISNVSRGKGSSTCATLSYITAEKVRDERTGELYNYGRHERVMEVNTLLPQGAPQEYKNPSILFNSIEQYEKSQNARTGKKIMVALPREFELNQQKEVIENFIKNSINSKGYACTYAIHQDKDNNNPHCHILIANRQLDQKTGEWTNKRKMEYALDEKGERIPIIDKATGEQKVDKRNRKQWKRINVESNPLDIKETLKEIREAWANECNKHLEKDKQIDHRSYQDRGIEQIPTIHEGYAARQIEAKGQVSDLCQMNREIRARNKILERFQEQLKTMKKQMQTFIEEKGASINDRLGDIIKRRTTTQPDRGVTDRERTTASTTTISTGTSTTNELIGSARTTISSARTNEQSAAAERGNRVAERIRLEREKAEAQRRAEQRKRRTEKKSERTGEERTARKRNVPRL